MDINFYAPYLGVTLNSKYLEHNVLQQLYTTDPTFRSRGVVADTRQDIALDGQSYVYVCTIWDSSGYCVQAIGEANYNNTYSDVRRRNLNTTAFQRAFDLAMLRFLGVKIGDKVYPLSCEVDLAQKSGSQYHSKQQSAKTNSSRQWYKFQPDELTGIQQRLTGRNWDDIYIPVGKFKGRTFRDLKNEARDIKKLAYWIATYNLSNYENPREMYLDAIYVAQQIYSSM